MGFKTYTCPIAKSCGGCEWLAVPYPIQLKRKREAVTGLFSDILPADIIEGLEVYGMDADGNEPVRYRHKAATPFSPGPLGLLRARHAPHRPVRQMPGRGPTRTRGAERRRPRRGGHAHSRL